MRPQHQKDAQGQLARSAGANVETVRYYQRIGLIELPRKPYDGVRSYDNEYLRRLLFIRRAQKLGFSLEDVRALLDLSSADCQQVQKLAVEKLNLVKAKLRQLRDVESVLTKTIQQCGKRKAPEGCPIIEALAKTLESTLTPYAGTGRRLHAYAQTVCPFCVQNQVIAAFFVPTVQ